MATRHLEVMVGAYQTSDLLAIRDFLKTRGFNVSETVHGTVLRIWADNPHTMHATHRPRRGPPGDTRPSGLSDSEWRTGHQVEASEGADG